MNNAIKKSELRNIIREVVKEETSKGRLNESNTYLLDYLDDVDSAYVERLKDNGSVMSQISDLVLYADEAMDMLGDSFDWKKYYGEYKKYLPVRTNKDLKEILTIYVKHLEMGLERYKSTTFDYSRSFSGGYPKDWVSDETKHTTKAIEGLQKAIKLVFKIK